MTSNKEKKPIPGSPEYQRQWRLKNLDTAREYHYHWYRKKKANMTVEEKREQREKWNFYQRRYRLRKKQTV